MIGHPQPDDRLHLDDEPDIRPVSGIGHLPLDDPFGQLEVDGRGTGIGKVLDGEVGRFANDAGIDGLGGADKLRSQLQRRVWRERGGKPVAR